MGEKKRKKQAQAAGASGGEAKREPSAPGESALASSGSALAAAEGAVGTPDLDKEPPLSSAPLPLATLEAEWLGGFFELCFADKRLVELCRELKLTAPGYRLESLPPEQVARLLADEYLAAEEIRPQLEAAIREALRSPLAEAGTVPKEQLNELLENVIDTLVTGDPLQQLARIAWAGLLAHEQAGQAARSAINEGLLALEAPQRPAKRTATLEEKEIRREIEQARRGLDDANKRAERAERERDSLGRQLSEERAAKAELEARLAEERAANAKLRGEQAPLLANLARLTAAGDGKALTELRRAEAEARGLAEKISRLEEANGLAEARVAALEKQLAGASAQGAQAGAPAAQSDEELPGEEEAATFLLPVFTREFYDSIDRWSRRMQRAAFDKIHRLAGDWRHGSLRALELGGLPGYYRIRVATDVRLIYRREGNTLEILSLIDREDLDRYIRQARTR